MKSLMIRVTASLPALDGKTKMLVLAVACGLTSTAHALRINTGASDVDNRRFPYGTYTINPLFLGAAYDLSGVSVRYPLDAPVNGTATMISPHYFVTATHFGPYGVGTTLHFVNRDGQIITKTVAGSRQMLTRNGLLNTSPLVGSDVMIGKLAGDGITAADNINFFPIVAPFNANIEAAPLWSGLTGNDIFVYSGISSMAGVNTISSVSKNFSNLSMGISFIYDTTAPQPAEQAGVDGDSGSPWGWIVNGGFTLGGVHSAGSPATTLPAGSYTCFSSFLPYYIPQINAYMSEAHPAEQVKTVPNPLVLGQSYFAGVTKDLLPVKTTALDLRPAPEWVRENYQSTLSNAGTTDKVWTFDKINLINVETVYFKATIRVRESDTASNFETNDRIKVELITQSDVTGNNTISLIGAWDTGNGASSANGANGAPDGYINGYTGTTAGSITATDDYNANKARDELNPAGKDASASLNHVFNLSYTIPADARSAQLVISGRGISDGETFTISDVVFSTVPDTVDFDSDGVPDMTELVHGTNPRSAASVFKIANLSASPTPGTQLAQFSTVRDRRYQGYVSPDLVNWTKDGSSLSGTGNTTSWPLVQQPTITPRQFLRIHSGHSEADFPATTP